MLSEKRLEKLADISLVILLSYFGSKLIPAFTSYEGMGSILMKLAPSVLIFILYLFYKYAERPIFRTMLFTKGAFTLKHFFVAVLAAMFLFSVFKYSFHLGLTVNSFFIVSILGIAYSILQLLVGKKVYAFIALLTTLPFIRFLELQAMYSMFSGTLLGPFIITPINIVILTFAFFYLARTLIDQRVNLSFDLSVKLYLAFALFCLISTLSSPDISTSFIGFIVEVLIFPFFFFLVKGICKDEKSVLHVFYAIVGYVSLRLIFSLYMSIRYTVASGSLYLALNQIEVLTTISTMAIPLAVGLYLISNRRIIKLSAIIIILAAFSGIVFGDKREPIIALLLTTLPFLLIMRIRYKKIIFLFAIISMLGLIVSYSISYQTHLSDIPITIERIRSDSIRISAWIASFGILKDYPLFGIGFGNFANFLDSYAPRSYSTLNIWPLVSPHNFVLHYLTSIGIFASCCLFLLIAYTYVLGIRVIKNTQNSDIIRNLTVAILWSFSCFLVAANAGGTMVQFAFSKDLLEARIVRYMLDFGLLFWLSMGIINRIYSLEINSKKSLGNSATIGNR